MEEKEIYLDNSASTKIREEALAKYVEISRESWGNPSSLHKMGFVAEKEIKTAEASLIRALSAKGSTVVFTASGTEANNLAVLGRAYSKKRYKNGGKIITTEGEHASVAELAAHLSEEGFKVVTIPTRNGVIDLNRLSEELDPSVILVSVMAVNNETGARYDTAAVSRLMRSRAPEAVLHVDATQSFLKYRFTKASIGADMISVSSHKIEGPKGIGALVIDEKIMKSRGISPIIRGGGQGSGLRSGTENTPAIAAFGTAVELGFAELDQAEATTRSLRNYFIEKLAEAPLSSISPTLPEYSAPHIINITLPSIKSETMLHYLSSRGIYVSSGSACSSNSKHVSSALLAYGRTADEADCSIRISFSKRNTREDVDALAEALSDGIARLARIRK